MLQVLYGVVGFLLQSTSCKLLVAVVGFGGFGCGFNGARCGSKNLWMLAYGCKIKNSRLPEEWVEGHGWLKALSCQLLAKRCGLFLLDDVMMFEMWMKGGNIKSLSTIHYQFKSGS